MSFSPYNGHFFNQENFTDHHINCVRKVESSLLRWVQDLVIPGDHVPGWHFEAKAKVGSQQELALEFEVVVPFLGAFNIENRLNSKYKAMMICNKYT